VFSQVTEPNPKSSEKYHLEILQKQLKKTKL